MPTPDSPALGSLRARIDAAFAETPAPDAARLASVLASPLGVADLAPWVRFAADRYTRAPVASGPGWELRLLCWAPGQSSALHGHGRSACAFRVLTGTAEELRIGGVRRLLRTGSVATAVQGEIHQVGNLGPEPLVTLHLYSPPLPVDQPSSADGHRVIVVGGGFCGAALAIHLLAQGGPALRVTLVERGPDLGRGVAYGTRDAVHLLNVPAAKMSLDPADPMAFLRFARARGADAQGSDPLPRALYGEYVGAALAEAVRTHPGRLRMAAAEAVDVDAAGVHLSDGRVLPADEVVLATGHLPPLWPAGIPEAARRDPRTLRDAWDPGALDRVGLDERVLVVGTGLTAVDVLLALKARGHRGSLTATSRHGRWPHAHLATPWTGPLPTLPLHTAPRTAEGMAAWFGRAVAEARSAGIPWQVVLDALRPHIPAIWAGWSAEERAAFLARYRSRWEILRHRAPPASLDALAAWTSDGSLDVVAGEILDVTASPDALRVTLGGCDAVRVLDVDRLILCTGADTDVRRAANPVLRALLSRGRVRADPLGLGLEIDAEGRVLGADGQADPHLWVLGAARRALLWETTAVPELARQAVALARALVEAGPDQPKPRPPGQRIGDAMSTDMPLASNAAPSAPSAVEMPPQNPAHSASKAVSVPA